MKHIITLFLLMVWTIPASAAEPKTEQFRFYKDIQRTEPEKENIVGITFDSDAFAATRDGLPDVRVLDAEGKQMPIIIEKVVETTSFSERVRLPSRVVKLDKKDDRLRIVLELLDDESGAEGLTVVTPLKNYERRVRVFGSGEDFHWFSLEENGLIFDYSEFMDVENRDVRLADNEYRRYAVEIVDIEDARSSLFREMTRKYRGTEEVERVEKTVFQRRPFRIDRIEMWKTQKKTLEKRDKKAGYRAAVSQVKEDLTERVTNIDISARRQPITELTLETSSANFNRTVRVQVPVKQGINTEWRDIARGKFSKINFDAYERQSLTVSFPEQRSEEFRIVIENGDNRPLDITDVKARGNVYRAVFIAEPNVSYRLAYGSKSAEPGDYDAAAVLAPLRAEGHQPVEAELGMEIENEVPDSTENAFNELIRNPLVWGTVIVVLVVLLGWALYSAAHRIDRIPPEI